MAPLPVGLALSACGPLHLVAPVADEADHIVEVEAVAHRATVYGTAWVSAADGCKGRRGVWGGDSAYHCYVWLRTENSGVFSPPSRPQTATLRLPEAATLSC